MNLGTPDAPTPEAVGRYLREFLMDPWVIDIPWAFRWFLVNVLIVPRRKHASAALYQRVWTDRGSPLLFHTEDLAKAVQERLPQAVVRYAMRYGNPSMASVLEDLRKEGVDSVDVAPLYPQYSLAASESSARHLREVLRRMRWDVPVRWVPPFYDDPGFLEAVLAVAKPVLDSKPHDAVLFSFHGLPERQVQRTDPMGAHCLKRDGCCDAIGQANRDCYRAQSFATARELAKRLVPAGKRWLVGFQSRLGNTPWIRPYSDHFYDELPKQGVRRLAVLSPSFVADCLETLEEIALRGAEQWKERGGEELFLVPCVNAAPAWADALVRLLDRAVDRWPSPVGERPRSTERTHQLST